MMRTQAGRQREAKIRICGAAVDATEAKHGGAARFTKSGVTLQS
ncbi:hypothetical protein [Enorma phocaeensis]|nr:hypothetical protein [Enorma phocaeensis]